MWGRTTAAWVQVQEVAGTGAGDRAGDRARGPAGDWAREWARVIVIALLSQVPALDGDFGSAAAAAAVVEGEDPAQLHLEMVPKARRDVQGLQCVWAVGECLAELDAAEVLERGWGVAGTGHLHAAFGCCGTHHGVEALVLQPAASDTCWCQGTSHVYETITSALTVPCNTNCQTTLKKISRHDLF